MNTQSTAILVKVSVSSLIFLSLGLPSGTLVGIPVKHIAYLICVVSLFVHWRKGAKINSVYILLLVASFLFIIFFILVATLRAKTPFAYAFQEGMNFGTTLSISLFILMANSCKAIKDEEIVLSAFYAIFFFSLWKFLAVFLITTGITSVNDVISFFSHYTGYMPLTLDMPGEYKRLTFMLQDFASAFFLFLVPTYPRLFSKAPLFIRIIFMFTGLIAVVSGYSRYTFIILAAFWSFAFLFKFSFKQRLLACSIVAVIIASSFPWLIEAYEFRFTSHLAVGSDKVRYEQTSALLNHWENLPILGGGFGYYAKDYVRLAYLYEVQWVSFLTKFGLIGISFLAILVLLLFYKILSGKKTIDHYAMAFALLSYLLSGFTNPLLLTSPSAILYVLPVILSSIFRKELVESHANSSDCLHIRK